MEISRGDERRGPASRNRGDKGTKAMVKTRSTEHRTRRRDTNGKWEATKGKCETTTAGNLGGNRTGSSIVRGHKQRTIEERKHRVCVKANALSGNKTRLTLDRLGLGGQGILTGGMSMRAEWDRTMVDNAWQRRW
jgi:hypothetical protein